MSEYQYYEFQAIDTPLDEKDMRALRELSSRALITPTSFVNTYNFGDFKGNPLKLMEKHFDAFLYVANWGTHEFMLKVPLKLINFDLAAQYCFGENVTAYKKGENVIFEFNSDTDNHEWEEGEGWLSSLISLRLDIMRGDYRCLYLGWLYCAQAGDFQNDEPELPVPPNLDNLNGPLQNFAEFMRIDTDLIAVAAENSSSEDTRPEYQKELKTWIHSLPEDEKDEILLRLVRDHSQHIGIELMQRFRQTVRVQENTTEKKIRRVEELITKAEVRAAERKRRIAEKKAVEKAQKERERAIAREKYLNDLVNREDTAWKQVEDLIETRGQSDYDEAVKLLVDLRDLSKKVNKEEVFQDKLRSIHDKHCRKSSFVRRLKKVDLCG